jgi:hypothetical protein
MEYLKSKEQIVAEKLGSVNESVFKMGDTYKVKTTIDIPKSLINAFVSKAKKDHDIDPRENWSDVDLAEMFVNYINATFVNIESLPVNAILGEKAKAPGEVSTEVAPAEVTPTPEEVPATEATPEVIPAASNEPTAEIQNPQ